MSRLHIVALAGAMALAGAAQADQPRDNPTREDQTQQRDNHGRIDDPRERNDQTRQEQARQNQPGGDLGGNQPAQSEPESTGTLAEYAAELKKCDQMSGNQKTQCVESVKKKFGQM